MEVPKIFESEYRFCLIVWEKEPVNSGKLNGKNTSTDWWMCFSVCPAMAPGTGSKAWFPAPPADRN